MNDFYEQFVGRKDSRLYNYIKFLMYATSFIALVFFAIMKIIGFIIFAVIAVLIFVARRKLYVEYEYSFTNGEIDIDKIIDKNNRKTAANFQIRDIELMAKAESDFVKSSDFKYDKELNCYNNCNNSDIYSILTVCNQEKLRINFGPDKKFIEVCFSMNPRKVKTSLR
ncbi:DUF6106 family protein [Clostridium pasteurianum]|uniref:Uncharacterized protein n=1 Tax=Clostridium pasteurianum BC1 TaxID=86416 RepID=R4JZI0_CLOPA|nr:DUF6106 family protein [Clostridium pasteurianum]AGK96237.1 hypothetical protein Clopa_1248 [Clostridium pasteurianum BC1]